MLITFFNEMLFIKTTHTHTHLCYIKRFIYQKIFTYTIPILKYKMIKIDKLYNLTFDIQNN